MKLKNIPVQYVGTATRKYWATLGAAWLLTQKLVAVSTNSFDITVSPANDKSVKIQLSANLFTVSGQPAMDYIDEL